MVSKKARSKGHSVEFPKLVPKTDFARDLLALRAKIVASGDPPLDWEGVQREVAERRGGLQYEDG